MANFRESGQAAVERLTWQVGPGLEGVRLLPAEDNGLDQEVVQAVLWHEGALVGANTLTANGERAVEALKGDLLGLDDVAMDMPMPLLDGLQAAETIREHPGFAGTADAAPDRQRHGVRPGEMPAGGHERPHRQTVWS